MSIPDKTLADLIAISADFAEDPMELATLAALRELRDWRENAKALLSTGDADVIRCHEGGAAEDLIGSVVLTVMRTRNSRDKVLGGTV